MSRPIRAPLVVALSALLFVPTLQAEPTAPLFVVEQQRSALVTRLAKQWSGDFAVLPGDRRLTHEQLSGALFALRADRLFAITLAGDAEAVEAMLADAKRDAAKPRVAAKALGDAAADLTYTPINPCRILDTRATVAGPLSPNVARTFDGYSTDFSTQGGTASNCGMPNGVAAIAMNVYAVNPTNLGFIKVWPANAAEPAVSTVNYQVGITAIATGALVPVDVANSNRFTAKSPATVDFIADVVGYFKPPGDANGLDIKVAAQRVMRYEPNSISPNVIGGSPANNVTAGVRGATIAGGGVPAGDTDPDFNDEAPNRVTDAYGTVGGGYNNRAGNGGGTTVDAAFATIGGGKTNIASGRESTVGGGFFNNASQLNSTVGGGAGNRASAFFATVGGGVNNRASGDRSTVGGGEDNIASGPQSTVPGGNFNEANGAFSFAAGRRVKANATGVVAFADSTDADWIATTPNSFVGRFTGGYGLHTNAGGGVGCFLAPGGGSWSCVSSRDQKQDFVPVDGRDVLERVASLPITEWRFRTEVSGARHMGPTAQDFRAAFGLGDSDKAITAVDADGVALAAIQGLNAKLDAAIAERDAHIAKQDQEIAELKRAVEVLLTRTSPEGRVAQQQ